MVEMTTTTDLLLRPKGEYDPCLSRSLDGPDTKRFTRMTKVNSRFSTFLPLFRPQLMPGSASYAFNAEHDSSQTIRRYETGC